MLCVLRDLLWGKMSTVFMVSSPYTQVVVLRFSNDKASADRILCIALAPTAYSPRTSPQLMGFFGKVAFHLVSLQNWPEGEPQGDLG